MQKLYLINLINFLKNRTIISNSKNKKELILLIIYLFDWKYILVHNNSVLNVSWKIINSKLCFVEYDVAYEESNYMPIPNQFIDNFKMYEILQFILCKLSTIQTFQNTLLLARSTYPLKKYENLNPNLNLMHFAYEYKLNLNSTMLNDVTTTQIPLKSKLYLYGMHYLHKLQHINFTNTKVLNQLIYSLQRDINIYRYDFNTGLHTRHDMMIRLNMLKKANVDVAIIMYDINGLHEINRLYGFSEGDKLIKAISENIKALSGTHTTYTTGGDEFYAVYEDISQVPKSISVDHCCYGIAYSNNHKSILDTLGEADKNVLEMKKRINKRRRTDI